MRQPWDATFRMPVIEFLNVIAYMRDRAEEEKRQIKKWKERN
jgi:hypothetical protein